jgi:hypothetical protein
MFGRVKHLLIFCRHLDFAAVGCRNGEDVAIDNVLDFQRLSDTIRRV